MSNKTSDFYFLKGGGEMGELIRAKDWSKTSLGDPAEWPQPLRTMVAVMLDNPFGMYIAWGSEYTQLYNDAYRPILGANKHPHALGNSTRETFSEIWHIIESMFDGVMKGKAVGFPDLMLPLNRNGFVEDCYFDFAYSPIRKDNGEVGGVLVTVIETTNKKKTEESLKESNDRFRNTMKQAPVGITILRGPEYIVEMANDAYLQLVDKKECDFVGKPLFTSLPEVKEAVHSLLDNVLNTGESYHGNEVPIPVNRYGKQDVGYFDFIWHPLKEEDGKVSGVLAVVTEATEKVVTRKKIEDSEKRYNLMLMQSPFAFLILKGKDMVVHLANASMKEVLGKGNNIEGKPLLEVIPEIKGQAFPDLLDKVYNTGIPFSANEMLAQLTRNGILEDVYFNYVYQPYHEADGTISGVTVIAYNITSSVIANKKVEQSEQRFRLALAGSNQIVFSQDKNLKHTWIYNPHPDFKQNEIIGKTDKDLHVPESAAVLTSIKQKVLDTGNSFKGDIEIEIGGKKANYTLYIEAIKNSEGTITGIIGTTIDITERIKIEQSIKESEEQFSALADNMENLAWLADGEGWIYWYNKRWLEYTGLTLEEMQGWGWQKVHHPDHVERVVELSKKIWHKNETFELTFPLRRHDGEYRWFLTRGYPVTNEEGKIVRWIGTNTDIDEQKKAEDQFRVLADQAPMWVWLTDKEVNLLYANPEVLKFLGISHYTEFTGIMWEQKVHSEDIAMVYKSFGDAASLQQSFSFEFRVQNAMTQQYEWYYIKAVPRLEEGEFTGFIGTGININQQKTLANELEEKVKSRTVELKASEEKFYSLFNLSPICKTLSDVLTGKIIMVNDAFTSTFGYNRKETINKTSTELGMLDPYSRESIVNELKTRGTIQNMEVEFIKKSGEKFFALTSAEIITIDNKLYFLGAYNDISDRKKAEKYIEEKNIELENKTIQLEEAQQLAHIGSWEWDVPTNKIYWSDELYRIYGLTPQEFEADYDNFIKYVYPDDREYVNAIVQKAFKDHQPYRFFHKTASADGNVRILNATGKVITDGDGNVIRMSGTAQDVTEQKKYEEELKSSEERFFKIFDSNPIPMTLSEIKTNKIKYANNLFYNLFGYTEEEVIGNSSEELNLIDAEEYKRVIDLIFGYLHENRSLAEVQALSKEETETLLLRLKQSEQMKDFEICYTRKNGETFPAIVSFELIRIGNESYTVTSYQDITERKKIEKQLKNQNEQLEKMNKELESFAYISSHDLQEPLRKIQTFATRISEKEENNLSDHGKDMFKRMQNSAKRMQTLIQDLLAYSHTNTANHKRVNTNLNKIIAEVKEDLQEELLEKYATVEANELCIVKIIPFQFRQLMHNLIGNSLKFSHPEQPPHIIIKCEIGDGIKFKNEKLSPKKKYCHISVSDNGIGFEQEYSEKIFEVFQRLHGKNEYNGTGIGLSIVKKIIENHNGVINAKGELNKGATFDIYIPAT